MQLKVGDLRIGNVLFYGDRIAKVSSVYRTHFVCEEPKTRLVFGNSIQNNFQPIPLTEEWLVKFGFKKDTGDIYHYNFFKACFTADNPMWFGQSGCCQDETIKENIKYVHELQNIYYAITNQELTCN